MTPGSSTRSTRAAEPAVAPQAPDVFRLSRGWKATMVTAALLAMTLIAGTFVQLPVYSLQPGPARDVIKLISIKGDKTFPTHGELLLTTVAVSTVPVSLYEGIAAMFDPATQLVPRSVVVGPGLTDKEQDELNTADILQSKYAAAVVALRSLRRDVTRIPGARILFVFSDKPASGVLKAGDVVTAANGHPIADVNVLSVAISSTTPGKPIKLSVARGDKKLDVTMNTQSAIGDDGKPRSVIGVSLVPAFRLPVDVQIDTQDIGGPSGGLVFSLAIVDVLSPGDLTQGHIVAATGTIDLEGQVGEIGGIEQKVRAAERSGADLFIVPFAEAAAAKKVASPTLRVVGVRTLDEALSILNALPPRTF